MMEHAWGRRLCSGIALLALLCTSVAFGQGYEPDDEDAIPPAPIPHPHAPPAYDPGDDPPPMEPELDRFPRERGAARLAPYERYLDRLPPPPVGYVGPRPVPIEPEFERAPPRERNSARLMAPRPLEEPPRLTPKPFGPPRNQTGGQLRDDQFRPKQRPANLTGSEAKAHVKPVAARHESSPPRIAPPPTIPEKPAPAPVAAQITRAPEKVVKPRSDDSDAHPSFVNKGEGKVNLEER
ncbi:MAG: hypothetical protein ACR652_09955 [Methylocystis sp.]|uniref:hypothetical protein n=1 Tax=Methylocystis sp. TaxID=1911079 RepID=UPI003DA29501